MALFNEIQVGRYNRLLQKLFSMKGGAPAPQVASEIVPVLPFFSGAENRHLEQWSRFAVMTSVAAAAANTSGVRIRNPATSNVVAVLEKVRLVMFVQQNPVASHGTATADLAVVTPVTGRLDPRANPGSSMAVSNQNTAPALPALAGSFNLDQVVMPAATGGSIDLVTGSDQQYPLLPGDAYQFDANALNVALTVVLQWRERFLEDSERA